MIWLSNRRAAVVSCIAIVTALGMVNGPAWADGWGETSIDATLQVFAAAGVTGARVLRDDEMGEVRGGFLGGLLGILETLPETNIAIVQDGDNIDSDIGPGLRTAENVRPGFEGRARADSSTSRTTVFMRTYSSSSRR